MRLPLTRNKKHFQQITGVDERHVHQVTAAAWPMGTSLIIIIAQDFGSLDLVAYTSLSCNDQLGVASFIQLKLLPARACDPGALVGLSPSD